MAETKLVVVTGGEGFIGRDVRSVLLSGGDDVISLDRQNGRQSFGGLSLECDITDGQRVEEIFASMSRQVYGIAHLASTLRTASERDPKQATEVNILGSLNVLEAARKFGVAKVVFASSISIYGSKGTQDDVSETDYTAPEDMYGAAKKYIEVLGNTYSHKFGIQFVSMRIPIVVGSGPGTATSAWRTDLLNALREARESQIVIPFAEDETLSIVHVEDLANAFATLSNAESIGHSVYNAPCEVWHLSQLKREVEALNSQVRVSFGDRVVSGFPRRLNCDRFKSEFGCVPNLSGHLRRAAQVKVQT